VSAGSPRKVVEFFFDYLSPFAYFAALRLPGLCRDNGAELRYSPVLFAGLLDHWGHRGPAEIPPKAINTFKLCARYAAQHGIPYRSPRFHPFVPLTALRVSLAEVGGDDQAQIVDALYALGWGGGGDLGDADAIAAALCAVGLDGEDLVERARKDENKQRLRTQTERAIGLGAFGVPTMIFDGELFWGVDQLAYLELRLQGRDPLDRVDLDSIASQGRAAERPGSLARSK
jgi:2-hydroxychromene-2-carboxylate isomerase